jgi:LysR family transcriptional regulator for metE and metH
MMNHIHDIALRREDYELLVAVAEEGSITRAADRLHLTQSAISHHLKALERVLGQDVFIREPRRTLPTGFGRECVEQARAALRALRRADAAIAASRTARRAPLSIGTECYTSYHWLPRLTRAARLADLDYDLRVAVEATRRVVPSLLAGEIDLAVLNSSGERSDLTYVPLLLDEVVLVVPADHALATRGHVTAEDLQYETLIIHETQSGANSLLDSVLAPAGVAPRAVHRVQLTEAIVYMVAAGWGVSALARWMVEPYLAPNRLAAVRVGRRGLLRQWRVAFRNADPRAAEFSRLARALAQELKEIVTAGRRQPRSSQRRTPA